VGYVSDEDLSALVVRVRFPGVASPTLVATAGVPSVGGISTVATAVATIRSESRFLFSVLRLVHEGTLGGLLARRLVCP
jgi:hypothetical protein